MPITKSAKKALRQNPKKRKRNLQRKKRIKEVSKKIAALASEKNLKKAEGLLPSLYKALDKAAKTKTIKKNTASRKKSRITKMVNRLRQ